MEDGAWKTGHIRKRISERGYRHEGKSRQERAGRTEDTSRQEQGSGARLRSEAQENAAPEAKETVKTQDGTSKTGRIRILPISAKAWYSIRERQLEHHLVLAHEPVSVEAQRYASRRVAQIEGIHVFSIAVDVFIVIIIISIVVG